MFPFLNEVQNEIKWKWLRTQVLAALLIIWFKEGSKGGGNILFQPGKGLINAVSIQISLENKKSPDADIFILKKWLTLSVS